MKQDGETHVVPLASDDQWILPSESIQSLSAALAQRTAERDRWYIECERLGIGLLEASEDWVDAPSGEVLPEQAVDASFAVIDGLTKQSEDRRERAEQAEAALTALRATINELQAQWQADADRRGRGQTTGLPAYRVLENCAASLRDALARLQPPKETP